MTLQTSGPISLKDIQNEFGGNEQLKMYYRGGSLVPNTSANQRIPTNGLIHFSDFYGATKAVPYDSGRQYNSFQVTVPNGIDQFYVDEMQAGGGGGGPGTIIVAALAPSQNQPQRYAESGGSGGGSGGWRTGFGPISVNGGDTILVQIGSGGGPNQNGQSTQIFRNGSLQVSVDGGGAGHGGNNGDGQSIAPNNPGGTGGSPDGNSGQNGYPPSNGNYSGGNGGNTVFANGGAGGGQGLAGNSGTNGSGGGGGGWNAEAGPFPPGPVGTTVQSNNGGSGGSGFARIHWP